MNRFLFQHMMNGIIIFIILTNFDGYNSKINYFKVENFILSILPQLSLYSEYRILFFYS